MVDLHPAGPGMPDGHRWLELGRWSMAWRVTVWCAFVGMLGMLLLGLIWLGDSGAANIFVGPVSWMFGLLPAPLFGLLAALLGPWLRRFFPFTQGIVFGLLGVVLIALAMALATVLANLSTMLRWCDPADGCSVWSGIEWIPVVLMFSGLPLLIMAGAGLGIAILVSNRPRARRICSWLLLPVAVVYGSLQLLIATGALDPHGSVPVIPVSSQPQEAPGLQGPPHESTMLDHDGEPLEPGMCADYDAYGAPIVEPCGTP